jgi:RNA polymerase sigma-70 factor (ECF subfamily)
MDDSRIVDLYWQRDERAIDETDVRYGRFLLGIAGNILVDRRDSQESVNDTYLKAWNAMPPHRPGALAAFLAKITRGVAIDRYRRHTAVKREGSVYALSLDELSECVSGGGDPVEEAELQALAGAITAYLTRLTPNARQAFVCRYFLVDSLETIAARQGSTVSAVKSLLHRTRVGLRQYLTEEGFML